PATVTVAATSTSVPSATGASTATIIPMPTITSVSPSPVLVGNFTLTVNGAGFTPGSIVSFDGVALATTSVLPAGSTATGNAPAIKSWVPVFVSTTDGEVSNTVFVNVAAAAVSISISPTSAAVVVNTTRQFTATVQNTPNTAITWKVNGIVG